MEADHSSFNTMRDVGPIATSLNDFRQLLLLAPLYGINLLPLNPFQRHTAEMKLGKPSYVDIALAMCLEHGVCSHLVDVVVIFT